jgi:hypothetical protein
MVVPLADRQREAIAMIPVRARRGVDGAARATLVAAGATLLRATTSDRFAARVVLGGAAGASVTRAALTTYIIIPGISLVVWASIALIGGGSRVSGGAPAVDNHRAWLVVRASTRGHREATVQCGGWLLVEALGRNCA